MDYPVREMREGDPHPLWPRWHVERIVHSPTHTDLVSYRWVRDDGKRGDWMGWRFRAGLPRQGGNLSEVGPDFTLRCIDKTEPMDPATTPMTGPFRRWWGLTEGLPPDEP